MSRINVNALQQPADPNGEAPDFEILPDDFEQEQAPVTQKEVVDTTPHLTKISEQMSQLNQTAATNARLAQLASDPQIAEILRARQEGRKVKIAADDNASTLLPAVEEQEPEVNWEALAQDPRKMGDHLTKTVTKQLQKMLLPAIQGMVEKQSAPMQQIMQQMQVLQQSVGGIQQAGLQQELNAVRNVNPEEFDRLKPTMSTLIEQHPTLNFKQVYAMARLEAGLPVTQDHSVQTERPNSMTSTRPPQQQEANPHASVGNIAGPGRRANAAHPVAFAQQLQGLLKNKNFSGLPGVT